LSGECLNVRAWEWGEVVGLQEVEYALAIEIGDDADVIAKVEALP
jgi:hypothetical protein